MTAFQAPHGQTGDLCHPPRRARDGSLAVGRRSLELPWTGTRRSASDLPRRPYDDLALRHGAHAADPALAAPACR